MTSEDAGIVWSPASSGRTLQGKPAVRKSSARLGLQVQRDTAFEKVLFGLLALAAVIGIAYGFSCLVDLVQNWAAVNAGIRNLI